MEPIDASCLKHRVPVKLRIAPPDKPFHAGYFACCYGRNSVDGIQCLNEEDFPFCPVYDNLVRDACLSMERETSLARTEAQSHRGLHQEMRA